MKINGHVNLGLKNKLQKKIALGLIASRWWNRTF